MLPAAAPPFCDQPRDAAELLLLVDEEPEDVKFGLSEVVLDDESVAAGVAAVSAFAEAR